MALIRSQATCIEVGALDGMSRAYGVTAAELHERHLEDVFRYVLRRVGTQEEAEDITAEVFTAAFVALPRFRGQCPPYLWLLSIARRKIIDARRRRAARRETLASELEWGQEPTKGGDARGGVQALHDALVAAEGPEAAVMRAEARRMLGQLVAQLGADQREALLLHYMEGLSIAEIAVVMARSHASVKSLLQRARATLHHRGRAYFLDDAEERKP
jgi:RNA polymerase sigma-70 factor (ECF subfamily)